MKSIITAATAFGPFQEVLVLEDRLRADGVEFQFTVLGEYSISVGPLEIAPEVSSIPQAVPMRDARLALYAAGLLAQVEAQIAGMEGEAGDLARIDWATALTVRRDSPLVARLGSDLGMTEAQIDALFIQAVALGAVA